MLFTVKTKILAFQGKTPVQWKIVNSHYMLEQVISFKYLRYTLNYLEEKDMQLKIQNYNT
jgi:hypothetical protein